jgi:hypothetical protein
MPIPVGGTDVEGGSLGHHLNQITPYQRRAAGRVRGGYKRNPPPPGRRVVPSDV